MNFELHFAEEAKAQLAEVAGNSGHAKRHKAVRAAGAYRIFWHYGPGKDVITVIAITPHP